jgi:hypothetical protein
MAKVLPTAWDHRPQEPVELRGRQMAGTGSQDEIRELLQVLIEAQNSGNVPRLRALLSERPDAIHIGTDAEEW